MTAIGDSTTHPSSHQPGPTSAATPESATRPERLGFFGYLVLLYVFFEFARPPNPMKIPMVTSLLLFFGWLSLDQKKWNTQILCMLGFLAALAINIPLAENYFSAYVATREMAILFLCIMIPTMHFIDSLRKVRIVVLTLLAVFTYIGLWAVGHGGYGPAGAGGAQDQNYVALAMSVGLPLAYVSLFIEKGMGKRLLLGGMMVVFILATIAGQSRGGFLALSAVFLYILIQSPKRWLGIGITIVLVGVFALFAPKSYWDEMESITDTSEGTADMRLELWGSAVREFLADPVLGVGGGNFRWRLDDVQTTEQYLKFDRSLEASAVTHSLYFELLAELGLVGVTLFSLILARNYRDLRQLRRHVRRRKEHLREEATRNELTLASAYRQGLTGSFVGFLVSSVFLSTLYLPYFWLLTALLVCLRDATVRREVDAVSTPSAT